MEEMMKTLPKHTSSWMKGGLNPIYKYQDFWLHQGFLEGGILAQQTFKAEPSDVFLCSYPKSGNTWLKALAFAIVTRATFDKSTSPLLTNTPHKCVLFLEKELKQIQENRNNSQFQLVATHLPYPSLPDSIIASNCKIVYVYRNVKDVIVSYYHFVIKAMKSCTEDVPFEEAFNEFYQGLSTYGPYWNHISGFWKASLERPELIFFFKYEDMKRDPTSNLKRLAEFIGYPFSTEEVEAGVVDNIIELCSFENLSNLEVNKTGMRFAGRVENQSYFRKAKDGDWENYFTDEMKEKIDKLIEEKLGGTGLVLK